MTGVLYVVSTPIGNLSDITLRALETLKSVSLIAAEDTRTTGVLLEKYGIKTQVTSYHKFSERKKTPLLIEKLKTGNDVALVSDAGTPLISDPGNIIVSEAVKNGIKVVPVGGISALTAFLSSTQRKDEDFKFIGFLPKTKNKIENIILKNLGENLVFYESPNRLKETLEIISSVKEGLFFSIGRELTKKFEEIKTDTVENIILYYSSHPLKGEIVCMLHKSDEGEIINTNIKKKIESLCNAGFSLKDATKILEITDNISKNKVKKWIL